MLQHPTRHRAASHSTELSGPGCSTAKVEEL